MEVMIMYKTKPNDVIILREEYAYYDEGKTIYPTGELILTTSTLVFTEKNQFKKGHLCSVLLPLDEIQFYNDRPQIKRISKIGDNWIEIYTKNGEIHKFGIGIMRKKAKTMEWVNAIIECLTGQSINEDQKVIFGFKMKKEPAIVAEPMEVIKNCQCCGAPIKGFSGRFAQCEYCGSGQRL